MPANLRLDSKKVGAVPLELGPGEGSPALGPGPDGYDAVAEVQVTQRVFDHLLAYPAATRS